MSTAHTPTSEEIKQILLEAEPQADQLPEQFLHRICEESAQGREILISDDNPGDPFLTWDQVHHIAEVAKLIAACLSISKSAIDIANIKKKLPPDLANHPASEKIIKIIVSK